MEKKKIEKLKKDSYEKWSFLRDLSYKTNSYKVGESIRTDEIKEYKKYKFLKKLSEAMNEK